MALNDSSVQSQPQSSSSQQQPQQQQKPSFSFHNGGLLAAPIGRGVGSEYYSKLKTNLGEVYKQANPDVEIALLDLDIISEPALAFSTIIVAMRHKRMIEIGVAYHLLIIEATGDKLNPVMENINNQQVEIIRVASDALDNVLLTKAHEKVSKAYPNTRCFYTEGVVVPVTFNPDDKTAVHKLALTAGLANGTELELHSSSFKDINLSEISSDSTLIVNTAFSRQQIEDSVGLPQRSDVILNFQSRKNNQQVRGGSVNTGDREVKVSEVSGFIDLVWNPLNAAGYNPYAQMQSAQTQKYMPRLVITNLTSNYSYTPGSIMMALATALSLRVDNNWIQAFRPVPSSANEIDLTDIGALNIEANLTNEATGFGTRIDTKADNFRLEDLGQLVSALIQPGLIVSIDCPEAGAQSWYLTVFAAAAAGSVDAYTLIYESANRLTNGNFERHFPRGGDMFTDRNNRVHLGTWIDRNGVKRDIRDIDHLAVCNLVGDRNPTLIRDFSDTYLRTQYPLATRLAARKKMISGLTNETAVFTGFAQRITFTSAFLNAIDAGIKETGLAVRVNTPLSGSDFNNQRGVGTFANNAALAAGQSFMTFGGFGYAQPQEQYIMGAGRRWG